jgi:ribosomal protein L16 Arg81 hydroxylase
MPMTLADLLAPITPERFFAEYHDRKPLHVPGRTDKFASVVSWRQINRLLDMTHVWSSTSLRMVMDNASVPAEKFCVRAQGRDGQQLLQPSATLVQDWIRRGASLVMNDVDSLTPGLAGVSAALEGAGLGKAQANIYISWQDHPAFATHYDTHDVWAVQVEGEKTWNIWEGRAEWPIGHPVFRNLPQSHHDQAKGQLRERLLMKPGDLLYLPRGWYHDALAEASASVHVTYGVHAPLGMDIVNILLERALHDTAFRQPLPRQDGSAPAQFALTTRIGQLGQRLAELCRDPKVLEVARGFVADYRYERGGFDLLGTRGIAPAASPEANEEAAVFRVLAQGTKPVRRGAEWALKTPQGALSLDAAEAEAAGWVLARSDVTEPELAAAHPAAQAAALLRKLADARLLARS